MVKYVIIQTEEIQDTCPESKDLAEIIGITQGGFDIENLKDSEWDSRMQKIPQEKLDQFREKGLTAFTINTQTIITLIDPDKYPDYRGKESLEQKL